MDLSEIDVVGKSNDGARMELTHPTTGEILKNNEGDAMYIRVAGLYSDHYQKSSRTVMDRRLSKQKGRRKISLSAEQIENENTETVARCVVDWNIVAYGEALPCNFDNAYKVLMDPTFRWLRDQVEEFMEDDTNFT